VKDPYQVLGVGRAATADEIKSAFRKLAAKHHPDRNGGDESASQRFKEINAAYQILSDSKKRAMYDRFGPAGVGDRSASSPFHGVPIDFSELHIDGIFGDLLEVLGIRFGDRGDLQTELVLTFEEAAFGCTKTATYDRVAECTTCAGRGNAAGTRVSTCTECGGKGRVRQVQSMLPIPLERTCARCGGTGKTVTTPCAECRGAGMHKRKESLEVTVPAGVENASSKRIAGKGNAVRGRRIGDLEVVFRVKPHELFRRSGDDVVCTLPITFAQAALGDEIEIPTLDGKGVLRVPAGTQPGTTLRVRGKGIPKRLTGGRGDQLVEVHVEIPSQLNDRQKELIVQLSKELGESVQPQRRTFAEKLKDLFS
jgi:molecular chaperone DnaJ